MRQAQIMYKGEVAGKLIQHNDGSFSFTYEDTWIANSQKPPVSLTLPKSVKVYNAKLFSHSLLICCQRGVNKHVICKSLKIDEDDYFGLLLNVAQYDAIGAVTVKRTNDSA
jgi:HipA-like protein